MRTSLLWWAVGLTAALLGTEPRLESAVLQLDPETPLFAFGVVADAQYCDCEPVGSRHYRRSLEKLAAAVDSLNARQVAFTVHLGDLIDRDWASFERILPIYDRLDAPAYHVLGNHEFSVDFAHVDRVPELLGVAKRYTHFAHAGWRFVVLDGTDLSGYATREGTPRRARADSLYARLEASGAPNAKTWNGALGPEQMAWLRRTLEAAAEAGERVVVMAHFPVVPEDPHNLWNDADVRDLLEAYDPVVAYLSGHNHAGAYAQHGGVHYVTIPGMVETPEQNAFAVVEVYPDRLEIDGYGRVPDRVLAFDAGGGTVER